MIRCSDKLWMAFDNSGRYYCSCCYRITQAVLAEDVITIFFEQLLLEVGKYYTNSSSPRKPNYGAQLLSLTRILNSRKPSIFSCFLFSFLFPSFNFCCTSSACLNEVLFVIVISSTRQKNPKDCSMLVQIRTHVSISKLK